MGLKAIVFTVTILGSAFAQYALMDGISGALLSTILGDTTTYASGYSDAGFRLVRKGMTEQELRQLVGSPLAETWGYVPSHVDKSYDPSDPCPRVFVRDGRVEEYVGLRCERQGVKSFMPVAELQRVMGPTTFVAYRYTESVVDSSFRLRVVYLANGRVVGVKAQFYAD